jgi:hypothetical protein
MPAFLPRVMHYSDLAAVGAQNAGLLVLSFGLLTAAWLGDRIPRRWLLRTGSLLLAVFAIPFFNALSDRSVGLVPLFMCAGLAASLCNGPMCGVVGDLFPTRIRFSGIAVSFNLAFSIFSGIAPLAATVLVRATGSATGPAYYMLVCASLTFLSTLVLKRYEGRILGERAGASLPAEAPSFPAH